MHFQPPPIARSPEPRFGPTRTRLCPQPRFSTHQHLFWTHRELGPVFTPNTRFHPPAFVSAYGRRTPHFHPPTRTLFSTHRHRCPCFWHTRAHFGPPKSPPQSQSALVVKLYEHWLFLFYFSFILYLSLYISFTFVLTSCSQCLRLRWLDHMFKYIDVSAMTAFLILCSSRSIIIYNAPLTLWGLLSLLLCVPIQVLASVLAIDYGNDFIKASLMKPGVPFDVLLNQDSKRKINSVVSWKNGDRLFDQDAFNIVCFCFWNWRWTMGHG